MANNLGGARKGAGRKPSSLTVRTREIAEKAINSGDLTPLEYMLQVMRNVEGSPLMRFEAAKAAAPYIHPRLNAIEHTGNLSTSHEARLVWLAAGPDDDDNEPSRGTPLIH